MIIQKITSKKLNKKETRGAPEGNQNAAGKRGTKEYIIIFGQRWAVDTGNKILTGLKRMSKTQKEYIDVQIKKDFLNE